MYTVDNVESIKDLGVTYDSRLSFHEHMQQKTNTAYSMLGIINSNSMDKKTWNMQTQSGALIKRPIKCY